MSDYNPPGSLISVPAVNVELEKIAVALESKLDKDVSQGNQMEVDLDMNSHRVINHPDAVSDSDLITKGQVEKKLASALGDVNKITYIVNQPSIEEWDEGTIYTKNTSVRGSDGLLYFAKSEQSGNNPVNDILNIFWEPYVESASTARLRNTTRASRLKQKLDANIGDVYVLCQGDSTSDQDFEFFRVMANKLSEEYPAYTFRFIKWNHNLTGWESPVVISEGSGPNTIDFYNGSFSGATHGYWTGNRNPYAYDNKEMDVILTNYGLNVFSSWRAQAEQMSEHLFTLRQQQPKAEILVTIQPTDYALLERSEWRADAQRYVAGLYGCQVIDIYSLFLDLVKTSDGDTSLWYTDTLHPTAAGAEKWADSAIVNVKYDYTGGAGTHRRINHSPSLLPNGNFVSWLNGTNDVPTLWKTLPGQTTSRDTSLFETNGASVTSSGLGSGTGILYLGDVDEVVDRYRHWGDILVAARIYSQGGSVNSGKSGILFAAHSSSTTYTEIQSTQGLPQYVNGNWRWAFLLIERSFLEGNSDFRIGVFTGEEGESCSIDRIMISPTLFPNENDGTSKYVFREVASDSARTFAANSVTNLTFNVLNTPLQPGMQVRAIPREFPQGLLIDAHVNGTGGVVVRVNNPTDSGVAIPATDYTFLISLDE